MLSKLIRHIVVTDFDEVIESIFITGSDRVSIMTHKDIPARVSSDLEEDRSVHFVRIGTADVNISTNGKGIAAVAMVSPSHWEVVFVDPDFTDAREYTFK